MSGTLTLAAGQVFTGGTSLGAGDTGQVALTQVGSVTFSSGGHPTISDVTITQDALASSVVYHEPFVGDVFIQSVTIDAVTTGTVVTLTSADLPPGVVPPPGFTFPHTVTGTTLDVTVQTNIGNITGTGQVGVYGYSGNQVLVGVENLTIEGLTVNVGAAILSLGTQASGTVDASFTPAFTDTAPCFAAGTHIATVGGDVPVERLSVGDRVRGPWGEAMPVRWLGHRRIDCTRHPRPHDVWPVRVRADAFRPGAPARDIWLSPDHAVFVAPPGMRPVLIPVRYLIDGASVVQERVSQITYWHVELERHAVLLAEGLPCESFLDVGNRSAFANGGGPLQLHPDFAATMWQARACAPQVRGGPALDWARLWLAQRRTDAMSGDLAPPVAIRRAVQARA